MTRSSTWTNDGVLLPDMMARPGGEGGGRDRRRRGERTQRGSVSSSETRASLWSTWTARGQSASPRRSRVRAARRSGRHADVSSEDVVLAPFAGVKSHYGGVDILHNNAAAIDPDWVGADRGREGCAGGPAGDSAPDSVTSTVRDRHDLQRRPSPPRAERFRRLSHDRLVEKNRWAFPPRIACFVSSGMSAVRMSRTQVSRAPRNG